MVNIMKCDFCGKIIVDYYRVDVRKNYAARKGTKKFKKFDLCTDCYETKIGDNIHVPEK